MTLQEQYDAPDNRVAIGVTIAAVCLVLLIAAWRITRRPVVAQTTTALYEVPSNPTPFNVLTLLRNIEQNNGLPADSQADLALSISRIERFYFAGQQPEDAPDLGELARTWVRKAR